MVEIATEVRPAHGVPRTAWRPVLAVAAVVGLVHLAVATRFGWHRDEFYYVITGRHLAWGYADQPPLTPVVARLAADLPGGVLPLHVVAVVAQLGCVVLAARLAAEFGGHRRAQVIAAGAIAGCPVFVGSSVLLGTTGLDQVVWLAVFVAVARALRVGTVAAWLVAGVVGGIGLENKDTVAVLLGGIAVGLVSCRRDVLRTPGPWLAGGVAVVLAVPNLVWNALHDWPQVRMATVLAGEQGGTLASLAQVPVLAVLLAGPLLVVLWVWGVRWLGSSAGREHRWVLVVAVVAVVVFTAAGGKPYYAAAALPGLFAAGAVRVEAFAGRRGRVGWPIAVTASAVLASVIWLPVLPLPVANALRPISPEVMETYGWPQWVDQVTRVADTMPPDTVIFANNYSEAGSLTLLGPPAGLHTPVYSAQNAYGDWGPPPGTPTTVLCVGEWSVADLHRFWGQVREIAPFTLPDGVRNQEVTAHAAIYLCQQPRGTWAQLWPEMRHLQ